MKNLVYLIFPLLLILCHCSETKEHFTGVIHSGTTQNADDPASKGIYKVKTIYNNDIEYKIKKSVHAVHQQFLEAIIKKDRSKLQRIMVSDFKDCDITYLINAGNEHFKDNKLDTLCEYYSIVESNGNVSYPILPNRNNFFIINSISVQNNEIYNLFKINENRVFKFLYHSMYILENNSWRVKTFWIGLYSIDNKNAIEWHKIAKESYLNANLFIAYFSGFISNKLLRTIPYLQVRDEEELREINDVIINTASKQLEHFTEKNVIIGFDFMVYPDRSYPLIKYVSTKNSADNKAIESEAKKLLMELSSKYENIQKYFPLCGFQAFKEKPADLNSNSSSHYGIIEFNTNSP